MRSVFAVIAIAAICLIVLLLIRWKTKQSFPSEGSLVPSLTTLDQIPTIVEKLRRSGRNGNFVVFIPRELDKVEKDALNLQYSVENGRIGLDWVLLGPRNIADEAKVKDYLSANGRSVSKRAMNGVEYLRTEGEGLDQLGEELLRNLYHFPPNVQLEIIAEGFDYAN